MIHLDGLILKTLTLKELDEEIGERYPVLRNDEGDYFIGLPQNNTVFFGELVNTDLVWESGNLKNLVLFRERPNFSGNHLAFDKADFMIRPFHDNLGFHIKVCNKKKDDSFVYELVQSVLDKYKGVEYI